MSKVERDLSKSKFTYNTGAFTFVFSSEFNRKRFKEKLATNRSDLKLSLQSRYGIDVDVIAYSDLILYNKIEKRGYMVHYKGEVITCQDSLKLDGKIKIQKNYKD